MEAFQLRIGQLYNLQSGEASHLVTYEGDVSGWLTFRSVQGKYQVWQYTPEFLTGITLAANTVELSPKDQPELQLFPSKPEAFDNPLADAINKPIIQPKAK